MKHGTLISFCKLIVVVQHVHSFMLVTESSHDHRIVLSVQAKRYAQWGTVIVLYYRRQSGDRNATRL